MVRKSRARSSSLFLMELILAIFFFSAASAVCVQFFVKSHLLNRDSNALNHAVNECSGIAEILSVTQSMNEGIELLQGQYPDGDFPSDSASAAADAALSIYYNDSFTVCEKSDASYVLSVYLSQDGQMLNASLLFADLGADSGGEAIYTLNTKHHIPRRTDYEKR